MTAISDRIPEVSVEYDIPGGRRLRHFEDAYEARRFYMAKDKEGKNPAVRKPQFEENDMAKKEQKPGKSQTDKKASGAPSRSKPRKEVAGPQPKPKSDKAATRDTKPAQPTPEKKPMGVRLGRTVPFLAGTVIRKHGMEGGVTPEMMREMAELRKSETAEEQKADLAWAWHAIRGYSEK